MKYGDFSSLVQLGVGLHVGTAILQLYGEIGAQPLVRTLARIKGLLPDGTDLASKGLREEYDQITSDFDIFKIRLFNEYKKYIKINACVATALVLVLTIIAFKADDAIDEHWMMITVPIVALSVLPAVCTLGVFWYDASQLVVPMKARADRLEKMALKLDR
jgi:hypothetical protein